VLNNARAYAFRYVSQLEVLHRDLAARNLLVMCDGTQGPFEVYRIKVRRLCDVGVRTVDELRGLCRSLTLAWPSLPLTNTCLSMSILQVSHVACVLVLYCMLITFILKNSLTIS
jgi:hypothetical protein